MKHEFRREKFIGCDPRYFEARLELLDEVATSHFLAPAKADDDGDDDDETDWWGDPLPKMQMAGSVACIPIKGIIATGYPSIFQKFGYVDLDKVASQVQAALADPMCKGNRLIQR